MSDKQPEAIRLAEHLERFRSFPDDQAAAAELRRLHEVNQELLEGKHLLYTAPPKRKPLTDEKLRAMWANYAPIVGGVLEFARAIEKAHGIGVDHDA